ncbi:SLAC1 anion channel family protein [uncultured Helicobacter sp.]|nr:SLAC1 anion channel family protein [uncultured Helicobacter sp.]
MTQEYKTKGYFSYLPISFFGACMGLSAISVAWDKMMRLIQNLTINTENVLAPTHNTNFLPSTLLANFSFALSVSFALLALIAFIGLVSAYAVKILSSFESVKLEFVSPLTRPFFGTFFISLLLLPFALHRLGLPESLSLAVWVVGAVLMFIFSVHIVQFWICNKLELSHITPAWIIPVVGLLDLPLALPLFVDKVWVQDFSFIIAGFCVGVGFFWSIVLCALIFARIVFFEKLPEKLMPTLVILLAPFGAGVSAYAVLIQDFSFLSSVDTLSYALLFIGLFLLFALLPQVFQIGKCCPFRISWWAISFPLAAMCIASLKITQSLTLSRLKSQFDESYAFVSNDEMFFVALSSILLIAVTLTFIWLLVRTLSGIIKGELKNLA